MARQLPDYLIVRFQQLADDFEAHIRADERQRLLERFRAEFPDHPVAKPAPVPMTDLHGEPLHESGPQPNHPEQAMSDKHYQLVRWLSSGTFFAVPTLAGHLGIKKASVYAYLNVLKKHGYEIEKRNTGNLKGGYRNIYRLAKTG